MSYKSGPESYAGKQRRSYQRNKTFAGILTSDLIHEEDNENEYEERNEQSKLFGQNVSPIHIHIPDQDVNMDPDDGEKAEDLALSAQAK